MPTDICSLRLSTSVSFTYARGSYLVPKSPGVVLKPLLLEKLDHFSYGPVSGTRIRLFFNTGGPETWTGIISDSTVNTRGAYIYSIYSETSKNRTPSIPVKRSFSCCFLFVKFINMWGKRIHYWCTQKAWRSWDCMNYLNNQDCLQYFIAKILHISLKTKHNIISHYQGKSLLTTKYNLDLLEWTKGFWYIPNTFKVFQIFSASCIFFCILS